MINMKVAKFIRTPFRWTQIWHAAPWMSSGHNAMRIGHEIHEKTRKVCCRSGFRVQGSEVQRFTGSEVQRLLNADFGSFIIHDLDGPLPPFG
jgi:hypothetical protein